MEQLQLEQQKLAEMKPTERPLPFQRWMNYDAEHKSPSDVLNRARTYLWNVDSTGRVLRTSIEHPEASHGELRDVKMLDLFFNNVMHNHTSQFRGWPYLFSYANEKHYVRSSRISPVLVREIIYPLEPQDPSPPQPWKLRFTYSPTHSIPFAFESLRLDVHSGSLIYPRTTTRIEDADPSTIVWMSFTNDVANTLGDHIIQTGKMVPEIALAKKEDV